MYRWIFIFAALLTASVGVGAAHAADDPSTDHGAGVQVSNRSGAGSVIGRGHGGISPGAKTTVGGQVFADFGEITQQQSGTNVPPTGVGFDIKRAYLIVNHVFDPLWSANLTTDVQYVSSAAGSGYSSSGTSNSGGVTEVFIKLLYLQARLNDAFVVRVGSYNSPWVGFMNGLNGYRWIEKTASQRLGYAQSADWGLHAGGVLGGNGIVNYSIAVVDGGGDKNPTRTKDVDFEGAFIVKPMQWLNIGGGFYSGHLGQVTEATAGYSQHTATRWDGVAALVTGQFRVGVEYFDARNFKAGNASTGVLGSSGVVVATTATGKLANDEADGVSGWASYAFAKRWSVFARYDHSRPSKDVDPNLTDTYYQVGVSFKPFRSIDLALVYKHERVRDGTVSVATGDGNTSYSIGGTGVAGSGTKTSGLFNEVGVYAQYAF